METDKPLNLSSDPDSPEAADTRARILEAALIEFAEFGIAGARVDRIAERAGVNKALLYYYYGKKQHLYVETLATYMKNVVSAARLKLEDSRSLEQTLLVLADHYRNAFLSRPEIPQLILRELADPDSEMIPEWAQRIRESGVPALIRSHVEAEFNRGELRPVDLRHAMVSFVTMQLGYYLMAPLTDRVLQIDDRESFVKGRPEAVVDLFLNGVRKR